MIVQGKFGEVFSELKI